MKTMCSRCGNRNPEEIKETIRFGDRDCCGNKEIKQVCLQVGHKNYICFCEKDQKRNISGIVWTVRS